VLLTYSSLAASVVAFPDSTPNKVMGLNKASSFLQVF
jgi:hypothetical protein